MNRRLKATLAGLCMIIMLIGFPTLATFINSPAGEDNYSLTIGCAAVDGAGVASEVNTTHTVELRLSAQQCLGLAPDERAVSVAAEPNAEAEATLLSPNAAVVVRPESDQRQRLSADGLANRWNWSVTATSPGAFVLEIRLRAFDSFGTEVLPVNPPVLLHLRVFDPKNTADPTTKEASSSSSNWFWDWVTRADSATATLAILVAFCLWLNGWFKKRRQQTGPGDPPGPPDSQPAGPTPPPPPNSTQGSPPGAGP